MSDSSMLIGWKNSAGGYTVSDRYSSGNVLPGVVALTSSLVALRVPKPAWAALAFTVTRPLKSDQITYTPTTSFIYGYASAPPSNPDSPTSAFPIHTGRGKLGVLDFTTLNNGTGQASGDVPSPSPPPPPPPPSRTTNGASGSTCVAGVFCVFSQPDGKGNVYITLHGSLEGWVSLGTGSSMSGSAMIVGWKNSSGGYTVSDRISSSHAMPGLSTSKSSELVPLEVVAPSWAKLAFTIFRPLKSNDVTYLPTTDYIYAVSSKSVNSPDDVASSFAIHDKYGSLGNLDFTTEGAGFGSTSGEGGSSILRLPEGIDYVTVIRIHGYVMIYAWIVCPIVAIFIARFLKDKLGHWWFRLHVGIMLFGCGGGTLGAILILLLFKSGPHFTSSPSFHPLLGLFVFIIMVLQMILGVISDKMWTPGRSQVPWWDKLHWWAGRIVVLLALLAIWTGVVYSELFSAYALAIPLLASIFVILGIGLFIWGERSIGQISELFQLNIRPCSTLSSALDIKG
jgi:hypothetical protein